MTKLILTNPATFVADASAVAQTTTNNAAITAAVENTLSRDGTGPNQMAAPIDMNSQRILNLPAAGSPNEPVRLAEVGNAPVYAAATLADRQLADADVVLTHADVVSTHADVVLTHADVVLTHADVVSANTILSTSLLKANNLSDVASVATTKVNLALDQVSNTTDANKPVSTAQATAIGLKANLASPVLTGTPTAPTAAALTSSTQLATTAYADTADAFKAPLSSPALTGTPTAPTATVGTNTTQLATTAFVLANGTSSGVSALNGKTGAVVIYFPPQGRLTLASGVPVMAASQAAQTTVYWTPVGGGMVPIYDGTNIVPTPVAEISQATTDATKSPAAVAASKIYDIFVWNDAGTVRATRGPAWTNNSTRGYTFTFVNGIGLNTSAITNGPAASRGTWVGTIASNASSSIDYIFGAAASGGTAAFFGVWNVYNRVTVVTTVTDSGASYAAYTSATPRQARASAGNQISFVLGAQEDGISFSYASRSSTVNVSQAAINTGVGFDVTNAFGIAGSAVQTPAAVSITGGNSNAGVWSVGVGVHVLAALEASDGTNVNNFNVNTNNALMAMLRL